MKKILAISLFFLIWFNCIITFAEDVYFTNRIETLNRHSNSASIPIAELEEGTVISNISNVMHIWEYSSGVQLTVYLAEIQTQSGLNGWINADAVNIKDSIKLPELITKNRWVHSYYLDVLRSEEKKFLFNYESFWRDHHNDTSMSWPWYDIASINNGLRISNIFLWINELTSNNYHFIYKNIEKEGDVYNLSTICVKKNIYAEPYTYGRYFSEGDTIKFTLNIDGDYLDILINGSKVFKLIKLDEEIEKQFDNLLRVNPIPVNFSRITWPRREDGTMDYPPPLDMSRYSPTHCVTENLRLRDSANTSSLIVTTLLIDTEVQVIETGASATINDITAPWVKVISSTGFTGWCFSGYLEEIAGNYSAASVAEGEMSVQKSNKNKSMPLPLLLAIIGGVTVIAGVVVVVLRNKKYN